MKATPEQTKASRMDAEGRCILCGQKKEGRKRGLCNADYQKFRRAKAKVSEQEYAMWEADLIAKGLLLPDAREADDPFLTTLNELRARIGHVDVQADGEEEKEMLEEARRLGAKSVAKDRLQKSSKTRARRKRASG